MLGRKWNWQRITIFSDSIVISYPVNLTSSLFHILIDLIHIQLDMWFNGILFRGSVDSEDICHKGSIVFGPGLVYAYKLESKCAIYSRIVLTKETIQLGARNAPSQNTFSMEIEYILDLLNKSDDGFYFIDYLGQYGEFQCIENYYVF